MTFANSNGYNFIIMHFATIVDKAKMRFERLKSILKLVNTNVNTKQIQDSQAPLGFTKKGSEMHNFRVIAT